MNVEENRGKEFTDFAVQNKRLDQQRSSDLITWSGPSDCSYEQSVKKKVYNHVAASNSGDIINWQ